MITFIIAAKVATMIVILGVMVAAIIYGFGQI
jgi:hypothetical protein